MSKRCEIYWSRFVASQVHAQNSRSEAKKIIWLQVAEMWLTEHVFDTSANLSNTSRKGAVIN
jgi:hypothetical protein